MEVKISPNPELEFSQKNLSSSLFPFSTSFIVGFRHLYGFSTRFNHFGFLKSTSPNCKMVTSYLFSVGASPKKSSRLLQWVVFSVHYKWSTFLFISSTFCREVNPDFSLDITFQNSDVMFSKFGYNVFNSRITLSIFPNFTYFVES